MREEGENKEMEGGGKGGRMCICGPSSGCLRDIPFLVEKRHLQSGCLDATGGVGMAGGDWSIRALATLSHRSRRQGLEGHVHN
jgi:hypothetical protein